MILSISMIYFLNFSKEMMFFLSSLEKLEKMMIYLILVTCIMIIFLYNLKMEKYKKDLMLIILFMILINLTIMFSSKSLFVFLIFMEMSLIPMSIIMLESSKNSDKNNSIFFMFMFSILGSLPFMYLCSKLNNSIMNFENKSLFIFNSNMMFMFSLLIFFCKIPMFMLHIWLSKAHVTSSMICSMLLASLMIKMGTFGIFKVSNLNKKIFFFKLDMLIISFSILSFFFMSLMMIRYMDMKNFIALSSVSHMSMLVLLILLNKPLSLDSSLFMMSGHGIISFCLFFLMGIIYEFSKNRGSKMNSSMESSNKMLSMWFNIYMVLNLGVPPLIIFFSEIYMIISILFLNKMLLFAMFFSMMIPIFNLMFMLSKFIFNKKNVLTSMKDNLKIFTMMFMYLLKMILLKFM